MPLAQVCNILDSVIFVTCLDAEDIRARPHRGRKIERVREAEAEDIRTRASGVRKMAMLIGAEDIRPRAHTGRKMLTLKRAGA